MFDSIIEECASLWTSGNWMQICEGYDALPGDGSVRADHVSKHKRTMFLEVMPGCLCSWIQIRGGKADVWDVAWAATRGHKTSWQTEITNVSKLNSATAWQGGLACLCLIDFLIYVDMCTEHHEHGYNIFLLFIMSLPFALAMVVLVDMHTTQGHRGRLPYL